MKNAFETFVIKNNLCLYSSTLHKLLQVDAEMRVICGGLCVLCRGISFIEIFTEEIFQWGIGANGWIKCLVINLRLCAVLPDPSLQALVVYDKSLILTNMIDD